MMKAKSNRASHSRASSIVLLIAFAFFALSSACRPPRKDPFVSMAEKYSKGSYLSLSDYYSGATGVKLRLKGIVINVKADLTAAAMDLITSDFSGAMPFVIEKNYGAGGKTDKVAIVATMDQFALVSALRTRGRADEVSTASVVKALRGINAKAKIRITGAGSDFVEFSFLNEPADWGEIARDCAAIAPNIVAFGAGDLKALESELKTLRRAILWWN
jgi:hypothetical protein